MSEMTMDRRADDARNGGIMNREMGMTASQLLLRTPSC
jgi:hypothetical protein